MSSGGEPVYLPGEYCEICLGAVGLGKWRLPSDREDEGFTICQWCYEDKPKLKAWFMREMKEALEQDPNAVRNADGTWSFTDTAAA